MEPSEAARRWLAGVIVGLGLPFFVLSTLMPLGFALLALVVVWVRTNPERMAAIGGLMIGFGGVTLGLFLMANANCGTPGTCYESSPALPAAAGLAIAGAVLTVIRALRSS